MSAVEQPANHNTHDTPALRLTTDTKPDVRPVVLHVRVVAGSGGGPDKTILRSPKHIDQDRVRMAAAYIHPKGDPGIEKIKAAANEHGCPLFTIPERGPLDPMTVAKLYQLCRKLRVTVWHGHDYKSNMLGLLIRKFWRMSLVTTVHGWTNETWRTRLYYHVDNYAIKRYDQVITVSRKLEAHCAQLGLRDDRRSYIRNAIALDEYERRCTTAERKEQLGFDGDRFAFGIVGRLSTEKGVDRAVRLISTLRQDYPHVELHIVGDGPQRQQLETLVAKHHLAERVHFQGWVDDPKALFEAFDALLLTSHTEGLPNVILEAMALQVPVIATNVGDVRRVLDKEHCGVILPDNEAEWPQRVAPLVVSEDRRTMFAERGFARVSKLYSFRTRMKQMMRVYDRVLSLPEDVRAPQRRRAA